MRSERRIRVLVVCLRFACCAIDRLLQPHDLAAYCRAAGLHHHLGVARLSQPGSKGTGSRHGASCRDVARENERNSEDERNSQNHRKSVNGGANRVDAHAKWSLQSVAAIQERLRLPPARRQGRYAASSLATVDRTWRIDGDLVEKACNRSTGLSPYAKRPHPVTPDLVFR